MRPLPGDAYRHHTASIRSGDLDIGISLKTVEYISEELEYVPWDAASSQLSYVSNMLSRTEIYGKFKKFMKKIVSKPFKHFGMDNSKASHLESYIRSTLSSFACDYDIEQCTREAAKMFKNWMMDPERNRIDPSLKSTVYCSGVASGDEDEWNFVYDKYKTATVAAEKARLLSALSCTKQTWILNRFIKMSLDFDQVRKQDSASVFTGVHGNPIGRDLAWTFLNSNWDRIYSIHGSTILTIKKLISGIAYGMNSQYDLQQLREFKRRHPNIGSGQRALEQAIEKTEANIKWMSRYYSHIENWLDENLQDDQGSDYRLSRSVIPSAYSIELFPDLYSGDSSKFIFTGSVTIQITCTENTSNFTLNSRQLEIDQNSVKIDSLDKHIASPVFLSLSYDADSQLVTFVSSNQFIKGYNYSIAMNFTGPLLDDLQGLYYSSYNEGNTTRYLASTQFESIKARKAFPCFDEPDLKAQFKVTLVRHEDKISLSNMPINKTYTRSDGYIADEYEVTPIMSTYLLAFVVGDFNHTSQTTNTGIKYGVWSRPESVEQTKFALDVGTKVLTFYEQFLTYPSLYQNKSASALCYIVAVSFSTIGYIVAVSFSTIGYIVTVSISTIGYIVAVSFSTIGYIVAVSFSTVGYIVSVSFSTVGYIVAVSFSTVGYIVAVSFSTIGYIVAVSSITIGYIVAVSFSTIGYIVAVSFSTIGYIVAVSFSAIGYTVSVSFSAIGYIVAVSLSTIGYIVAVSFSTIGYIVAVSISTIGYILAVSFSTISYNVAVSFSTIGYIVSVSFSTVGYIVAVSFSTIGYIVAVSFCTVGYIVAVSFSTIGYIVAVSFCTMLYCGSQLQHYLLYCGSQLHHYWLYCGSQLQHYWLYCGSQLQHYWLYCGSQLQHYWLYCGNMIAIPDFGPGAMENWGLITYKERYLLYKDGVTSAESKQRTAVVIAHELGHQWFGNLVTMKWWDDLWLNEGFATFMEYIGTDHIFPEWKMFDHMIIDDLHPVLNFDSHVTSHPIYVPLTSLEELSNIFDAISYSKGGSVIRMARFFLGEETFRKGLSRYLNNRKFQNADHNDLSEALNIQAKMDKLSLPADVKTIMDTWLLQMNYPVVMVTVTAPGKVRLSQKRFLTNPEAKDPMLYKSPYNYKWWIPVTLTNSGEKKFVKTSKDVIWFNDTFTGILSKKVIWFSDTFTDRLDYFNTLQWTFSDITSTQILKEDGTSWVMANIGQYGVYRVNYTEQNWRAIINQLKTNYTVISSINRAQVINDAWSFSRANQLNADIGLGIVEYLDKEMDYVPRTAANKQLSYLDSMLSKSNYYGKFKSMMRNLVVKAYDKFGLNSTGLNHLQSYMRSEVSSIACDFDLPKCITEAKRQFDDWMNNPQENKINPDTRYIIYCTAIRTGGEEEWNFAYRQYKQSTMASETDNLLRSLACSEVPWILQRYLQYAITPEEIRKQETGSILVNVASNKIGRTIAWNFVQSKWDYIHDDYLAGYWDGGGVIKQVARVFNTEFELQQLLDFGESIADLHRAKTSYKQAIETVQANIKWVKNSIDIVEKWLLQCNVHRFGRRSENGTRPIVAKFLYFSDLEMVKKAGKNLKGSDYGVNEQFPPEIEQRRRRLYPIMKEERRKRAKVVLNRDKLYVNDELNRDDEGKGQFTCKYVSVVDYVIGSANFLTLLQNFSTLETSKLFSDAHTPLSLSLCIYENEKRNHLKKGNFTPTEEVKKWDIENVDTFIENIDKTHTDIILTELESVNIQDVNHNCVNSIVKRTCDVLVDAAKTTFGTYMKCDKQKNVKINASKPWFDEDCRTARKKFKKSKKKLKRNFSPDLFNETKSLEKQYKRIMDKSIKKTPQEN
ncbi:ANPEP [Mytilus coruscus]|uniref:ANPEP n=1 Tax=Mytilus coruscus TaxID=42192 RepID=A0A6J8DRJ1_MYTCO|nr:unnamed protein product [Mytilus coruscus]CAC5411233.1 ANPEP [Mytilus coruscus]